MIYALLPTRVRNLYPQYAEHLVWNANKRPAISSSSNTPLSSNDNFMGSTANSLKQLFAKLAQWRELLPQDLQWSDDDPLVYLIPQLPSPNNFNQSLDPDLSSTAQISGFAEFTADLDSEPTYYPYVYDVQVALLRTRYYYTKYVLHQPFVYKALHSPENVTEDDARGVAECLEVSLFCWLEFLFLY